MKSPIASREEYILLSSNKEKHGLWFKQTWIHTSEVDLSSGTEGILIHLSIFNISLSLSILPNSWHDWTNSNFTTPKGACVVLSLVKIGPVVLGEKIESLECYVAYILM